MCLPILGQAAPQRLPGKKTQTVRLILEIRTLEKLLYGIFQKCIYEQFIKTDGRQV